MSDKNKDNFIPLAPKYENGPVLIQFPSVKLPIFWGPGQVILEDLLYDVPRGWKEFEPMRIPKVGRMIFAGKGEYDTEDFTKVPDGGGGGSDPDDDPCTWKIEDNTVGYAYGITQAAYDNDILIEDPYGSTSDLYDFRTVNASNYLSFPGGMRYNAESRVSTIYKMYNRAPRRELIFEGPLVSAPYLDYIGERNRTWVYRCKRNPNLVLDIFPISNRSWNSDPPDTAPQCWVARSDGTFYTEVPIDHHPKYGCGPYPV